MDEYKPEAALILRPLTWPKPHLGLGLNVIYQAWTKPGPGLDHKIQANKKSWLGPASDLTWNAIFVM